MVTFQIGSTGATAVSDWDLTMQDKRSLDKLEFDTDLTNPVGLGDEIDFQDVFGTTIFTGKVIKIENDSTKRVLAVDFGRLLQDYIINQIYNSQSPEEIIEAVITEVGTLTYTSTISSGVTIPRYVAKDKRAWDIVTEMAELLEADFRVDKDKNFILELTGQNVSSETISNSNANLDKRWEEDMTQMVNEVIVVGETQLSVPQAELFSGDGVTTEFELDEVPFQIEVQHPVGTTLSLEVPDQTAGDYIMDRDNKIISFNTPPAAGVDNIQIVYSYQIPIRVRRKNSASITTYGVKADTFFKQYIVDRSEASEYASFLIDKYSTPLLTSTWSLLDLTKFEDFVINEFISVTDSLRDVSGSFLIRKKVYTPSGIFITVGQDVDDLFDRDKELDLRIKQLEEKDNNTDFINEDEQVEENIVLQFDSDVSSVASRVFPATTFYLDDDPGATRNQMLNDGSGPTMLNTLPSTAPISAVDDMFLLQSGDNLLLQDGDDVLLQSQVDPNANPDFALLQDGDNILLQNGDDLLLQTDIDTNTDQGVIVGSVLASAQSLVLSELNDAITHMAVGDDGTAPTTSDTTLGNETYREAVFSSFLSSDFLRKEMFLNIAENNGNTISELGTFDAGAGGNMYSRTLISDIAKTTDNSVFLSVRYNVLTENTDLG